jgi:hypothetical protein
MMLQTSSSLTEWVADTGALNHTTHDPGNISLFQPPNPVILSSTIVSNGSVMHVTSVSNTVLPGPFYLNNVICYT